MTRTGRDVVLPARRAHPPVPSDADPVDCDRVDDPSDDDVAPVPLLDRLADAGRWLRALLPLSLSLRRLSRPEPFEDDELSPDEIPVLVG